MTVFDLIQACAFFRSQNERVVILVRHNAIETACGTFVGFRFVHGTDARLGCGAHAVGSIIHIG